MQVTPEDLKAVASLLIDLCGIHLDRTKGYLVESRLSSLVEEAGCGSYVDLVNKVRYSNDVMLRNKLIDALTTNETLFFRDDSPFQAFQYKLLPDLIEAKKNSAQSRRIRIWSAACSTGQEPYSIAMMLHETLGDIFAWDVSIVASDISDAAIQTASTGRYAKHEIARGMPPLMLSKYFNPVGTDWQVKDELRSLICFEKRNLLEPFYSLGPFDIIFCRNVAIYFTPETRKSLFNRLADTLAPHGYLLVGSSESLIDLGPRFASQYHCRAAIYQPNSAEATAAAGIG